MSQHDYNIANGGGAAVRSDINSALLAILSQNSGATAPTVTKPFMFWFDTAASVLKQRNADDTAWGIVELSFDAYGNVGIGGVPTHKLTVSSTGGTRIALVEAGNSASGAGLYLQVRNSGVLTGNATFRVNNAGRASLYVGTTSEAEQFAVDASGNLSFNAGFGSVAPAYGCRAWVNFYGTGTPGIRASGNVSSITDHGTGDYSANFTSAMPDSNFSTSLAFSRASSGAFAGNILTDNATGADTTPSAASIRVAINGGSGLGGRDVSYINVAVFR